MKTKATNHLMQISMKTFFKTLLAALTLVAAVSCAKETPAPKDPAAQPEANLVPYTLNIGTQAAKSFIDKDSTTIVWEEGDRLGVIDDVNSTVHEFTFVSSDGTSASFDGSLNEGASTLYVVYPYDENSSVAATTVSASLPAAQQVSANRTARGALLAVGTAPVNQRVSLKNAFGLVQVTVKHSDVKEIVLDGEGLSGVVSLDATTGEISGVPASSGAITLTPPAGDEYFKKDSIYYAAVLPGTTPAGEFSLEIRREMDADLASSATYTFTKAVTVPRNGGFYFNTDNAAFSWSWHITNKAELFAWNAAYAKWSKLDKVYIDADIDMQSELWTPRIFRGVLDGQNHKLYNFVTDPASPQTGFVSDLGGTVKNLVLGSSDGSTYDGTSLVSHASDSTFWCNVASVAARLGNNGKIENVTNFATVEVLATAAQKTRVGGIAGFVMGTETSVVNCRNYGAIKDNATSASSDNLPIGGILGSADNAVTISGCYNYGDITNNNEKVQWIGGIMGVTNGPIATKKDGAVAFKATISDCHNEGNITANAGKALRIGGIVGNLTGGDLSGCTNLGSITNNANVANYLGGVVGCVARITSNTLTDCTNGAISDRTKGNVVYAAKSASKNSYIGGIIGAAVASTGLILSGCKNYCNLSTTHGYVANLAGIAGCIDEKSGKTMRISDCHNYGTVSNTCTETVGDNRVAGLVAYCIGTETNPVVIENSTNEAAVTSSKPGAAASFVAGIVARGDCFILDGVVNTAAGTIVSEHTTGTQNQNAGGLVGYSTVSATIKGSSNAASVSASGTGICNAGGLFGNSVGLVISEDSNGNKPTNTGEIYSCSTSNESYVGGIGGQCTSITASNVVNSGKVHSLCAASNSFEIKCGGIFGQIATDGTVTATENKGEVYIKAGSVQCKSANAAGLVGVANNIGATFTDCVNSGNVHSNAAVSNQNRVAGFVSYGKKVYINGASENSGKIYAEGSGQSYIGGFISIAVEGFEITGTSSKEVVNSGEVYSASSGKTGAGGFIGFIQPGTVEGKVSYARNTAEIYKKSKGGHSMVAGICAQIQAAKATFDHCVNDGKITYNYTTGGTLLQWAGGIIARNYSGTSAKNVTVKNCTNNGAVAVTINSSRDRNVIAGGIVGGASAYNTIKDNVNNGTVSLVNTYANSYGFAGGIWGSEYDVDNKVTAGTSTVSDNVNTAAVTVTLANGAARIGAGGIAGHIYAVGSTITGNTSSADVTASSSGSDISGSSSNGGSGAVIGDSEGAVTGVTCTVSKNILVGGTAYSSAESAGTLNYWLCPNNGNITATYVD